MSNSLVPPAGREAVVGALVQAAADEFADRGYEAATIKAISQRAGVNHGLVHRHFGSKAQLLAVVLDDLADAVARELEAGPRPDAVGGRATRRFLRVLARSLLDGADVAGQTRHPVMERAVQQVVDRTGADPARVRVAVAQSMALELGWLLFEPFLVTAAGLGTAEVRQARDGIREVQRNLTDLGPSGSS